MLHSTTAGTPVPLARKVLAGILGAALIAAFCPVAPQAHAAGKTITVYVNISDGGTVVDDKDGKPVAMVPVELSGKDSYTIDDVLKEVHEKRYEGGAAAGYASAMGDYGLMLTKLWGTQDSVSYNFGYQINHGSVSVSGLAQEVTSDDVIDAYVLKNLYPDTESYTFFSSYSGAVVKGRAHELALQSANYDANGNMVFAHCVDATITVDGKETSSVTDSNGKASITFDTSGTHVVSAAKTKTVNEQSVTAITAPVCVVTVKEPLATGASETAGSKAEAASYQVSDAAKNTVTYKASAVGASVTSASVPAVVTLSDGKAYTVTKVAAGAFKNHKKLKKVNVGANVSSVAARAFQNLPKLASVEFGAKVSKLAKSTFVKTPKLSKITVKYTKFKKKSVKGALSASKLKKKLTVKVPKKQKKSYKKVFTKKNLASPKAVVVK